jgi:hypothetical protein
MNDLSCSETAQQASTALPKLRGRAIRFVHSDREPLAFWLGFYFAGLAGTPRSREASPTNNANASQP